MNPTNDPLAGIGFGIELPDRDMHAAGRLLALAVTGDTTTIDPLVVNEAATITAERGIVYAVGWVNGWWWSAGNHDPRSNRTWKAIRAILGKPVR